MEIRGVFDDGLVLGVVNKLSIIVLEDWVFDEVGFGWEIYYGYECCRRVIVFIVVDVILVV